jgi:hypothetical protein
MMVLLLPFPEARRPASAPLCFPMLIGIRQSGSKIGCPEIPKSKCGGAIYLTRILRSEQKQ